MSSPPSERWYVKKEGDARIYGLTERQTDAVELARNLSRSTGETFYAMKKPTTDPVRVRGGGSQ